MVARSYIKFSEDSEEHGWKGGKYLGEWSASTNKPHGRGIRIQKNGDINIGSYSDGYMAPGNYIVILSVGEYRVAECRDEEGAMKYKGTTFNTNGTVDHFDY